MSRRPRRGDESRLKTQHAKAFKAQAVDNKIKTPAERTMNAAFKLLAARPRSEAQLRELLTSRFGTEPAIVEECISRLKELGYLNDLEFARGYANHRLNLRPLGRSRLARELAGKSVSRQTISETLDELFNNVDEQTLVDRAIDKRIRTHGRPSDARAAKRLFDHLARLGFDYDLIARKLKALKFEEGEGR
jgi:regulatory protein